MTQAILTQIFHLPLTQFMILSTAAGFLLATCIITFFLTCSLIHHFMKRYEPYTVTYFYFSDFFQKMPTFSSFIRILILVYLYLQLKCALFLHYDFAKYVLT